VTCEMIVSIGCLADGSTSSVPPARILAFWQDLLNGPLIDLLQSNDHPNLRSSGCDCLASVGDVVFDQLPVTYLHKTYIFFQSISPKDTNLKSV